MYQNIKKAFTLVELIVVITILAILATVAFISFQGYALIARDSARLSDLSSMEKILTLYNVKNGSYPSPDTSTNITYSGATAWTQGVFGTSAYTESSSMSEVPVDPVTGLEYTYSITANGQEYQLGSVLENTTSLNNISSLYAGTQEAEVYIKGNYNGIFLKVSTSTTTYLLGVPSILASDITSVDLETIIQSQNLVYNGYKNLPASFSGSVYNTTPTNGFDFTPAQLVLFEGDIDDLETNQSERVTFLDNLQANYTLTEIANKSDIMELLAVDSNLDSEASNYVAMALNNSLKTKIAVTASTVSSGGGGSVSDCIFDSGIFDSCVFQ